MGWYIYSERYDRQLSVSKFIFPNCVFCQCIFEKCTLLTYASFLCSCMSLAINDDIDNECCMIKDHPQTTFLDFLLFFVCIHLNSKICGFRAENAMHWIYVNLHLSEYYQLSSPSCLCT